jgi:hypothetical protein
MLMVIVMIYGRLKVEVMVVVLVVVISSRG